MEAGKSGLKTKRYGSLGFEEEEESNFGLLFKKHTKTRIGQWNHQPYRKPRYVHLKLKDLVNNLINLYHRLFKVNWEHFACAAESFAITGTSFRNHFELFATVYISHWIHDLYYSIRRSLKQLDPVAFTEKYHHEVSYFTDRYDHFLSMLNAAIRPTHIINAISDEVFIPILDREQDFSKPNPLPNLMKYHIDFTLFSLLHQTLEMRKLVKMTPLSGNLLGRPSWLLDWPATDQAYAWFPSEGNYKHDDITVAYIVRVACTSKLGFANFDEWRYFEDGFNPEIIDPSSYRRVVPRRWRGSAEHRSIESEKCQLPNCYAAEPADISATNVGPLKVDAKDGTSSSSVVESEGVTSDYKEDCVPCARTRSTVGSEARTAIRVRAADYCYYAQVMQRVDDEMRFTAFRMFVAPSPGS